MLTFKNTVGVHFYCNVFVSVKLKMQMKIKDTLFLFIGKLQDWLLTRLTVF